LVIIGVALSALLARPVIKKINGTMLFILVFCCVFPVLYIIYKKSNVYGGWRHVLFIYPFLVMLAAIGFETGLRLIKNKYAKMAGIVVIALLVFLPAKHIAKNHPHEYVYYNEFAGGVEKAYGHFEMDYYYHSMRAATEWLIDYVKKNPQPDGKRAIVAAYHLSIMDYYLRNDTNIIQSAWVRYNDRLSSPWDYFIVVNSSIDASLLQSGLWPPKNTIHTIDVDGKPICAIIKRINKDDFYATEYYKKAQNPNDSASVRIENMMKAEDLYKKALSADPNNELILLALSEIQISKGSFDGGLAYVEQLLKVCPNNEQGLSMKGQIGIQSYIKTKNAKSLDESMLAYQQLVKVNKLNEMGYVGLANVYYLQQNMNMAVSTLKNALKVNPDFQQVSQMLMQLTSGPAQ
jgi:tetratricopeptide (TPR) repeat protein